MALALGPGYSQPGGTPIVPQYQVKGDYWKFSVQFVDPVSGQPVPITPDLKPDGLFYPCYAAPAYEMTLANGGASVTDGPNGRVAFVVPLSITNNAVAQRIATVTGVDNYATRLQCRLIDSIGPQTYTITGVVPIDPASTDLSTIPAPSTIIAYAGPAGAQGPAGPASTSIDEPFVTVAAVPGLIVVKGQTNTSPCDAATATDGDLALGISLFATPAAAQGSARRFGFITDPSFNFAPNKPVFCGPGGLLTQALPTKPQSAFLLRVGMATAPTTILVNLQNATTLA